MRVIVIGTGAMGMPTACVLAERGHDVVAIDRFGVGNGFGSSGGSTRIWRLAQTRPSMVRLAKRAVAAWHDLERRSGRVVLHQTGLLWRGSDAEGVHAALRSEDVPAALVTRQRQQELFPELVTDERPVVWQPEAGAVLADVTLQAHRELFEESGGQLVVDHVTHLEQRASGVTVHAASATYDADVAVITAGPWAEPLLNQLGLALPLQPVLEQVAYFAAPPGWQQRPAVIDDVDMTGSGGFYAMPSPDIGYKIGIERHIREWDGENFDRTPAASVLAEASELITSTFNGFDPTPLRSQVCPWTDGPDDDFVFDRVGDVVIGTSDGGQAFKFSALIGTILSDLVEAREPDAEVAQFSLRRFATRDS